MASPQKMGRNGAHLGMFNSTTQYVNDRVPYDGVQWRLLTAICSDVVPVEASRKRCLLGTGSRFQWAAMVEWLTRTPPEAIHGAGAVRLKATSGTRALGGPMRRFPRQNKYGF